MKLRILWLLVGSLFVAFPSGCGSDKPSAENMKICEQAAKRYITCTEEVMGKEMADMARSKKGGVEACARSQRTVDWYRDKCLPAPDCEKFMECTMELAMQAP